MARRTTTGAWWRTAAWPMGAWCSARCSTWARSTTASARRGARRSRFDEHGTRRQMSLFPAGSMPADDVDAIGVRLSELRLQRPRRGAPAGWRWSCGSNSNWTASGAAAAPSREGTPWQKVLKTLVANRLIDPGREWRVHRQWFDASAMDDLLDVDFALAEKDPLYRCLDRLVEHKDELFKFLVAALGRAVRRAVRRAAVRPDQHVLRGRCRARAQRRARIGYSRDKRGDCRQVVIALIVTPEGFPLTYEVLPGNTADTTTLERLPRPDRAALRPGRSHLGDGPGHPHRGQPGPDAGHRRVATWWARPRGG